MELIILHIAVCLGLCMIWEGILPLLFTKRWQAIMGYWSTVTTLRVQKFALNLVVIGAILIIVPLVIMYA